MPIAHSKDLEIGKKYFICFDDVDAGDELYEVQLESIEHNSELFPELTTIYCRDSENIYTGFNLFEIGIGETTEEALTNFKKIK